jgi:hypothetical protein
MIKPILFRDLFSRHPWLIFPLAITIGLFLGFLTVDIPIMGYDWINMFAGNQATDIYYPPWTSIVLWPLAQLSPRLGLAIINGITIATVVLLTFFQGIDNRRWRLIAIAMALLSPQTLIVLWTGHIDGLALLGIWALPWAIPIVLMKSTFIGFVVLSRKRWFMAALLFGLLSLLIWPDWITQLSATIQFRSTHPASGGWHRTGMIPIALGLVLFLFSQRKDLFQNMAAGAILYPFIMPYHHIVLLPALGALKGSKLFLSWLAAWLMIFPIALEKFYFLYFIFPFLIWWQRRSIAPDDETWYKFVQRKSNGLRRYFSRLLPLADE